MAPSRLALALVVAGMALLASGAIAQGDSGLPPETLAQSTPIFAFQSQGNKPALVFTQSGSAQEYDPRVFLFTGDGWRLVQLPDALHNSKWVYSGREVSGTGVWGIAQNGDRSVLSFVFSSNAGRNWRTRGFLQKISPNAVIELFTVNEDDKASLVLRLDEDPSPNAPRLGYYLYITKNGGKTWSEAIYSQGKPLPPPDLLAHPDRTFDGKQALDNAGWQRLLADLQPAG
jgi:hypothetical protein